MTSPAQNVTVKDFKVDGSSLAPWKIGNNGLIFVQGAQTGASNIIIENGLVRNCPPGLDGVVDKEHHAAITVKNAGGQVTIRNVEVYGCLSAFYFKYNGTGPILIEDSYIHNDGGGGGRMRSDDVTVRNTVWVGGGPAYQTKGWLVIEQSTFVNSNVKWSASPKNALRNSVVFGGMSLLPNMSENCFLSDIVYDHFADPDNGDYTLIGDAAVQCAGKGAQ